jgi:hypothetical protein
MPGAFRVAVADDGGRNPFLNRSFSGQGLTSKSVAPVLVGGWCKALYYVFAT